MSGNTELIMAPNRRTLLILAGAALALAAAPGLAMAQAIPRRGDYVPQDILAAGPKDDYAAAHLRNVWLGRHVDSRGAEVHLLHTSPEPQFAGLRHSLGRLVNATCPCVAT